MTVSTEIVLDLITVTPEVTINVTDSPDVVLEVGRGPTGPTGPEGPTGATGAGVPVGGLNGYGLTKSAATDYATGWEPAASQPTGIDPDTPSELDFTYGATTSTFTLTPTDTYIDIWIDGERHRLTGDQVVTFTTADGAWYISYQDDGWHASQTPWAIDATTAPVALIYVNKTDLGAGLMADERHGVVMDWATHLRLHSVEGTQISSGGAISGYTVFPNTNDNPAAGDNTYAVGSCVLRDEDITLTVPAVADGGPYFNARRVGAGTRWAWAANGWPLWASSYVAGAGYVQWNQFTGGAWQMTNLTSGQYVNYYVFATNFVGPYGGTMIVPGQAVHATLAAAQAESVLGLDLSGFPSAEFAPLWQVTMRASSHNNFDDMVGRCSVAAAPVRLVGYRSSVASGIAPSSHSALSNRSDPDSHPATAISVVPAGAISSTDVAGALNELDTEKLTLAGGGTMTNGAFSVQVLPDGTENGMLTIRNPAATNGARVNMIAAAGTPEFRGQRSLGTVGVPTPVAAGTALCRMFGQGHDGVSFANGPRLDFAASEVWSTAPSAERHGTRMMFTNNLSAGGAAIETARMVDRTLQIGGTYNDAPGATERLRINTPTTTDAVAAVHICPSATTVKPLVIQAAASQTANLTEWQSSTGAILAEVRAGGGIYTAAGQGQGSDFFTDRANTGGYLSTAASAGITIRPRNAAYVGLTVRGETAQTAELQIWRDASGTLLSVSAAGHVVCTTTGNQFGTATTQKLAFHGSAPVVQRAGAAQAAVDTTAATNSSPYGFSTAAQADAIVTLVNELRTAMVEKGLIKGAA